MSSNTNDHIRYVAAVRQPHDGDDLLVESSFCRDDDEYRPQIEKFASYKLKRITKCTSFYSYFSNHMGAWHIKGINGTTFIVVSSEGFPEDMAVECLDEFSELYVRVSKETWLQKRRIRAQNACCQAICAKYSSLEIESAPWILMNEVDRECRLQYSKSVRRLVQEVKTLEDKMHENIRNELQNMENAERLEELTNDCLEKAKVFRKKAKQVKWKARWKHHLVAAKGVALFATIGGVVGFLAGGPGGAFVLTAMPSVAGAEAVEASIMALVFGAGYLAAQSRVEDWAWNQKFMPL